MIPRGGFYKIISFLVLSSFLLCFTQNSSAEIKPKDPFFKSDILISTCLKYIKLKDYNKVQRALEAAYRLSGEIEEPLSRAVILNEITDKYTMLGENEKAFGVAQLIGFEDVRYGAFSNIALRCIELGEYRKATAVLKSIKDDFAKAAALYKIVNKLIDLGLYAEAVRIVKTTVDSEAFCHQLVRLQICTRKLLKEDYEQANRQFLQNCPTIKDPYRHSQALVEAAEQCFASVLYEPAKKILSRAVLVAETIDAEPKRNESLHMIELENKKIINFEKNYEITAYLNE